MSHGVGVLANTIKYISIKHPLKFYGIPGVILIAAGLIMGSVFLDAYLNKQTVFFGSLLGSVLLFLLGSILSVTAIILLRRTLAAMDSRVAVLHLACHGYLDTVRPRLTGLVLSGGEILTLDELYSYNFV